VAVAVGVGVDGAGSGPGAGAASSITSSKLALRRRVADGAATAGMWLAMGLVLLALGLLGWIVVGKGASVVSTAFLTSDIPRNVRRAGGGIGPAVVGTVVMTGAAALMAVPLGVLGAVYLNEIGGRGPLARLVRFMADVMAGVPSIVMGLFVYIVWVTRVRQLSGLAGAMALACLILPIVIRTTEEMLRLVPQEQRQASMALGARTWRTTLTVVLPGALGGIVSGAMLAIARAAGETAPLVFTAGIAYEANPSLRGQNVSLSELIFRNATEPFAGAQDRAWGAALTLVAIVFVCIVVARLVAKRFTVGAR
jgi:phosphate transport system permease protein